MLTIRITPPAGYKSIHETQSRILPRKYEPIRFKLNTVDLSEDELKSMVEYLRWKSNATRFMPNEREFEHWALREITGYIESKKQQSFYVERISNEYWLTPHYNLSLTKSYLQLTTLESIENNENPTISLVYKNSKGIQTIRQAKVTKTYGESFLAMTEDGLRRYRYDRLLRLTTASHETLQPRAKIELRIANNARRTTSWKKHSILFGAIFVKTPILWVMPKSKS